MLHPRRSLQDLVDGELSDQRRIAVERHAASCPSCSATIHRLRALKSALLGLNSPAPDPALHRRLLSTDPDASTDPHAEGFQSPDRRPTERSGSTALFARQPTDQPVPSRRRTLIIAAGGSAVVATAILASAYVVGSEERAVTANGAADASALRAGWDSVASVTPTALDTDQLKTLRAGGWYCPELESLGFTLQSAEGITVDGRPTLELVLVNGSDAVTVFEQRRVSPARDAGEPLNAVTGNVVTADGFEHIGGADRDVWVRAGEPWQVVLDSPSVTYTVVSSMPPAAMPQTLSQLVTAEHAQLAVSPDDEQDSMLARILRGLSDMTHPGADG